MARLMNACGVILAGGRSSRMGTNKALLELSGETLIQRLARRFQAWFDQVVVVTNSPEEYQFLSLPMVGDRIAGLGPLGGLEAGLTASRHAVAFFAACDMPFVDEPFVRHLVGLGESYDIVVPQIAGEYEPMHAVYRRDCLPVVTANLDARKLRLLSIFDAVRLRVVPEAEIAPFGQPARLFFNCNTPADLDRARAMDQKV